MVSKINTTALSNLLEWIDQNNDEGYDPYDIFESNKFLLSLQVHKSKLPFYKLVFLFGFNKLNQRFPVFLRKLFRIKKMKHATYMGCMFRVYLDLYEVTKNKKYLRKIDKYRDWLIQNRNTNYNNYCWGTPFSWRSGEVIYVKGTPFTVVCAWVGDAFYKSYQLFNNKDDLEICISICNFFLEDLHIFRKSEDKICFSYSPLKVDYVNNANLFAAEFLMRIGSEIKEANYIQFAKKAVNYTLDYQLENGMISYLGKESSFYSARNDSYHSSYEIRMLYKYWKLSKEARIKESIDKYLEYYLKQYYQNNGSITLSERAPNIVDISSIADAILLFNLIQEDYDVQTNLNAVKHFAKSQMQDESGYFYYKILNDKRTIKIPYIRWAQGWMAMALATQPNK